MNTKFVHHICIQTNNYEDSLKFYRDVLGFELIKLSPNFHNRYLTLDSVNPNTQGVIHFCLWVNDLVKEVQTIKQLGYDFIQKNGEEIYKVKDGCLCKIIAPELRDNRGI